MKTYLIRTSDQLIFEVDAESKDDALEKIPAEDRSSVIKVTEKGAVLPIFISGKRNGYSPESCGKTMTVGELIAYLSDFPENRPVYICNDNGYTYGSITDADIRDTEDEEGI